MKIRFVLSFLWLMVLFSCSKDDDSVPEMKNISVEPGTTSLLLSVINDADKATVPVYIALPSDRTHPVKAVVVLHGSGGMWKDSDTNNDGIADVCDGNILSSQSTAWKNLLLNNGMAAAFPDSYSPRGTCENEGAYKNPPLKFRISGTFIRNRDACVTLRLLKSLVWADTKSPVIDAENVAVLGFSDGGTSAISTVYDTQATPSNWAWKQSFDGVTYTNEILPPVECEKFKASVWYYPGSFHNSYYGNLCKSGEGVYKSYCDVLIHLPADDPLSSNTECMITTMQNNGGGTATVYRYPSTGHGFDGKEEPESTEAQTRTITFISQKLGN